MIFFHFAIDIGREWDYCVESEVRGMTSTDIHIIYECGICGGLHKWDWNGDCREDTNRYAAAEDYMEREHVTEWDLCIRSWEERCEAHGINS